VVILYSLCWFSQRRSPTPHFWGCALRTQGTMTPKFELGRDFCTVHLSPKVHHRSEIIVLTNKHRNKQTNKQRNTQTDAAKTFNALRYARTLGIALVAAVETVCPVFKRCCILKCPSAASVLALCQVVVKRHWQVGSLLQQFVSGWMRGDHSDGPLYRTLSLCSQLFMYQHPRCNVFISHN